VQHIYEATVANEQITVALCARKIQLKSDGEKSAYIFVGEQRIDKLTSSKLQIAHTYDLSPRTASNRHPNSRASSLKHDLSSDRLLPVLETRSTGTQTDSARSTSIFTQTDPPPPLPLNPPALPPSYLSPPSHLSPPSPPPLPPISENTEFEQDVQYPSNPISPFAHFPSRLSEAANFYSTDYMKLTSIQVQYPHSLLLFCFVLFCFVLFCFVLFCFVLFCFVLFVFLYLFYEIFVLHIFPRGNKINQ
jgi:hypothetical protein